jgi:sec-independent protein translocase protein TatA
MVGRPVAGHMQTNEASLDIQPWHLIVLLVIVMLLFGAKRLPEVGRSLGSSAREFKKGISGDESSTTTTPPPPEAPSTPVDTHDVEHH